MTLSRELPSQIIDSFIGANVVKFLNISGIILWCYLLVKFYAIIIFCFFVNFCVSVISVQS